MRIAFFGSGAFALPSLLSLLETGHEIVAVVSQPDRPRGRSRAPAPTPVKQAALAERLTVLTPPNVNDDGSLDSLRRLNADLGYVADFGQKIAAPLRELFPAGMVNLHASLLPELRGAAPIPWAIIRGYTQTGVTIFRLVDKMDAGPILVQCSIPIDPAERADELESRLARLGCEALSEAVELLSRDPRRSGLSQDDSRATLAPKLRKQMGRIRFDQPALELARTIRGLWPWPTASCRFLSADGTRDETLLLARAMPAFDAAKSPGIGILDDALHVGTPEGSVSLIEVRPAGGKLMAWRDFVNGRHVRPGDRLLPVGDP